MAHFLILRGAPGVGKSTVAALLRTQFPNGITVEVDSLRAMVHANPWGSAIHHRRAVGAAAQLALHYKASGYCPVLIVDTLGGGTAETLVQRLGAADTVVYTLIASDAALTYRICGRENHGFRDVATALSLNREIIADSALDHQVIETTALSPQATADRIASDALISCSVQETRSE